jgi:protein-tyrosine phosphatase
MGNLCRSPTAHGVFQQLVNEQDLNNSVVVDSAGTYAYQKGKKPDPRASSIADKRGYNLSSIRARKIADDDFKKFNYILAMDDENYTDLLTQSNDEHKHKIKRFLEFSTQTKLHEVPDPYYGGLNGFEIVLDLVEDASKGLLEHIKVTHLRSGK